MSNPNHPVLVDEGSRVKVTLYGENYYVYRSGNAMHITVPRENSPQMKAEREYLEEFCHAYTLAMGGEPIQDMENEDG